MGYRIKNYKKAERYGLTISPQGMLNITLSKIPSECTIDHFVQLLEKEEVIEYE